jgi:hypothetical protein
MSEILAPARISDIFLYYGFDNGYVLNRFYGHTGLYGNHHPVKPYMIFFIFHSLPPPSQVRLDVRPSAWYSSLFTLSEAKSLFQEHIKGGQWLSKSLCHFFMVFPYTLIFATSISLRYLKITSNWSQITEKFAFYKPLTIRKLIFTVDFMRCKSYQIRL